MGQTGLYIASYQGYTEIVRTLVDRGADLHAKCDDSDENYEDLDNLDLTPLHVAVAAGRSEVAGMLLEHGADVNRRDDLGRSPLHIASCRPYNDPSGVAPGIVRLLLDHGSNPNARTKRGLIFTVNGRLVFDNIKWTPLHFAAFEGRVEVVQLLLDYGADVNRSDRDHWTALHLAALGGHLQVVNTLLACGANPHARNKNGETPFNVSEGYDPDDDFEPMPHHPQIRQLLSEHTGESGYGSSSCD